VENPRKRGEVSENVWISNELISSVRCCISQIICKAVGGDGGSKRDWQEVLGGFGKCSSRC